MKKVSTISEKGATLVELAIVLPVILAIILFTLWAGVMYNAKSALASGMQNAVRLGLTRGNQALGANVLTQLNVYNGGPVPTDLLATSGLESIAPVHYATEAQDTFGANAFNGFGALYPKPYLYSLAYTHAALRESISDSLRYPCNQPGCVRCHNVNNYLHSTPALWPNINRSFVAVECEYFPDNTLFAPLQGLLELITGDSVAEFSVTSRKIFGS